MYIEGELMSRYFPTYNTVWLKKIRCIDKVVAYFRGTCYPKIMITKEEVFESIYDLEN